MQSTLSLTKADYDSMTGYQAGYGRGEAQGDTAWDEQQAYEIDFSVKEGLRRVYHCGYPWSFLKPFLTLTLRRGENSAPLPDDCGGPEGSIIVSNTASASFCPVKIVNPAIVQQMHSQNSDSSGAPQVASIKQLKGEERGQVLFLYPTADGNYTLKCQVYVLPNCLDGSHKYAYGGPEHVSLFLSSCLAVFEEQFDNIPNGPKAMAFDKLMKQSVMLDSRKKPQHIGQNRDRSDDVEYLPQQMSFPAVTYNGIKYGA